MKSVLNQECLLQTGQTDALKWRCGTYILKSAGHFMFTSDTDNLNNTIT